MKSLCAGVPCLRATLSKTVVCVCSLLLLPPGQADYACNVELARMLRELRSAIAS